MMSCFCQFKETVFPFCYTEETYITLATYEPQFEDEVKLEIGMVAMVMQKNLDGWWFVK